MRFIFLTILFSCFVTKTYAQPELISSIANGSKNFISYNNQLYFTSGDSLFSCDGFSVELIKTGIYKSGDFRVINGSIYFLSGLTGTSPIRYQNLWKSDGTEKGTILINHFYSVRILKNAGNKLFLAANDSIHGNELWVTDGTVEGTTLVKDINSGFSSGIEYNFGRWVDFDVFEEQIYFIADDGIQGKKIWKSSGTSISTRLLTLDLVYDPMQTGDSIIQLKNINFVNSQLIFSANYSGDIYGTTYLLCKADPSGLNAIVVKELYPDTGLDAFKSVGSILYFRVNYTSQDVLYRTNGTSSGTYHLKGPVTRDGDVNYLDINDSEFLWVMPMAEGFTSGIWRCGSEECNLVIKPNCHAPWHSLMKVGDFYLFTDDAAASLYCDENYIGKGRELWQTQFNSSGHQMVKNIFSNGDSSYSRTSNLTNVNGILYFTRDFSKGFISDSVFLYKYDLILNKITINKNQVNSSFQVFPNPASERITIQSSAYNEYQLKLINSIGTQIFQQEGKGNVVSIELQELGAPSGIYTLMIGYENQVQTVKVVIK